MLENNRFIDDFDSPAPTSPPFITLTLDVPPGTTTKLDNVDTEAELAYAREMKESRVSTITKAPPAPINKDGIVGRVSKLGASKDSDSGPSFRVSRIQLTGLSDRLGKEASKSCRCSRRYLALLRSCFAQCCTGELYVCLRYEGSTDDAIQRTTSFLRGGRRRTTPERSPSDRLSSTSGARSSTSS